MTLWAKTIKLVTGVEPSTKVSVPRLRKVTRRDLIRMESKIGATVFGPVPANHRREFFCLDEHTWVWYEEYFEDRSGRLCGGHSAYGGLGYVVWDEARFRWRRRSFRPLAVL